MTPSADPSARPAGLRRSVVVLVLVAVVGLAGTGMAALALHNAERDRLARSLGQRSTIISQAISAEVSRYSASLLDLAAAVGAQSELEAAEFTAITAAVDRRRFPGGTGLSFVVPAADGDVATLQERWRKLGATGLTLRPNGASAHRFAVLSKSMDDMGSSIGTDMSTSAQAVEAMDIAEQGHRVAVSRTYRLLKDSDLPLERRQLSFVFVAPVYATSPGAADNGRFRGWLMLGVRGGDFLSEVVAGSAGDRVAVTLLDDASGDPLPMATWAPGVPLDTSIGARDEPLPVAQRSWTLRVEATKRLLTGTDQGLDKVAGAVGLVLTALLVALTGTIVTSRNRALRRVDEATAALRTDIARREEVEHRLRQRETELVGFAGVVAHDLRSPLARIMGYADFLQEEAFDRLDPMQRDFLARLRKGADHMRVLIDDLLDYATAENRPMANVPVDLHRLAEEIARERAADRPAEVVVGDLPTVYGDPTLLRQVLDNLIGNAIKYTPAEREPHVRIGCHPIAEGRWRCEVSDNGIGIPENDRSAVFDAFRRVGGSENFPGTGLGLAIVHRIVERHHGRVGVDSNPEGGSVFWFTVPEDSRIPVSHAPPAQKQMS
ncbi:CHASE domain-containing protein [Actinoplanes sp. LDG1-06]|uniref:Sensor-like histidine kinase SenX3 n=1 Tax=Paractinoplanes ovalisporus TaxID=2810368 RepID=A0ABS2AMQ7_9ACTN|nr:ATP-binding protein [Actinoplanes ovalisporus]MBM2621070.1 CHASE domain-containing protein [Actinoplanes ovalisporus]